MYIQIALGKWDLAYDACMQIQGLENDQIDMLFVLSTYYLLLKGDSDKSYGYLEDLKLALEKKEPQNHEFYFNVCKIVSRICAHDQRCYNSLTKLEY